MCLALDIKEKKNQPKNQTYFVPNKFKVWRVNRRNKLLTITTKIIL